jgi:hypothetical protein
MMINMAYIKYKKRPLFSTLPILFILLIQSACSSQVSGPNTLVNCSNGTNPIPLEQGFTFPGDLLFAKRDGSEILAFNGSTHELTSIFRVPSKGAHDVSPLSQDGKTLVIFHQDPSEMEALSIDILLNSGTVENRKILLPVVEQNQDKLYTWSSVDWINGKYLQGVLSEKGSTGDELWESWLLNPYQLDWKSLPSLNNNLDQMEESGFSISPDLTRVLYVNTQYQLVLYDLVQNRALWNYSDYDGISPRMTSPDLSDAAWSPSGEMLALPITRTDGMTPGIVVLGKDAGIINSFYFGDFQFGLNWSKDGQLLSFYENRSTTIDSAGNLRPIVRIIGMKDGLLRDICSLKENTEPSQGISNNRVVWSPDQQFLAYTLWSSDVNTQDGIVLQKLSDPLIRIIQLDTDTMVLLGWSKEHWISVK